jgi:hypothetical protein
MAIQPKIAGYTGTLTGTTVNINPQADRGFVCDWLVVVASGSGTMTLTIGVDVLPVPVGIILTIPGPAAQFSVSGTGVTYIIYAGTGTAPAYLGVTGSGGGGGGAPTTATYLLDGPSAPGELVAAVPVGALDHTVDFVRVVGSSAGASTPLKLVGSSAANPLQVGGGVAFPLRQRTTAGEQTIAQIGAVWIDVSNPADPKGALTLRLGAAETLAMLIKLGEIDLSGAWTIKSSGQLSLQSGTASLDVGGTRVSNMSDGVAGDDAATVAQATQHLMFSGDGIPGGGGAWASGQFSYCRLGSTTGPTGAGTANGAIAELCNTLPAGATVKKLTVTVLANTLATLLSVCTVKVRIDNGFGSTTMEIPIDKTMAAGTVHTNTNGFIVPAGSYINVCLDNNVQVDVGALYLAIMLDYTV